MLVERAREFVDPIVNSTCIDSYNYRPCLFIMVVRCARFTIQINQSIIMIDRPRSIPSADQRFFCLLHKHDLYSVLCAENNPTVAHNQFIMRRKKWKKRNYPTEKAVHVFRVVRCPVIRRSGAVCGRSKCIHTTRYSVQSTYRLGVCSFESESLSLAEHVYVI